jgi:exonuclease III
VVVGVWNLEWLCDGKERGFPEDTHGGPSYDARVDQDYAAIAEVIENQLHPAVLVITEVNASAQDGVIPRSNEINRLCSNLGQHYEYFVLKSGGQQHVAMLYDKNIVRLNTSFEIEVAPRKVGNSDIFARDPLVGHFGVISSGDSHLSDFVVVGLHLASGQDKTQNHDQAMKLVTDTLKYLIQEGELLPSGEGDIILAGDMNLSIFDNKKEHVLEQMESGSWDILADDNYPATRCAGVPLSPQSQIDYLIVTDEMRGPGAEITQSQADVHQDLANSHWDDFRRVFSDHFPVTVTVHPVVDDD